MHLQGQQSVLDVLQAPTGSIRSDGPALPTRDGHRATDASMQSLAALHRATEAVLRRLKDQKRQPLTLGSAATPLASQHLQSLEHLAALTAPAALSFDPDSYDKRSPNRARTALRSGMTGGLHSLSRSDTLRAAAAKQRALLQPAVLPDTSDSQR